VTLRHRLRVLWSRALGLFGAGQRDAELSEEIQAHLDLLADEHLRQGLSPGDARLAARRAFGGVEQMKETYRDRRGLPMVEACLQDLRYALRQLRRNPGFAAVAILTLALGIGATTAIFSVIDAALLRPMSYPDPDRLVVINEATGTRRAAPVNAMHFLSWQAETRSFEQMALLDGIAVNLTGAGEPEMLVGARVTPNLFAILGVRMQLGRGFLPEEDLAGRDHVLVLDDGLWRSRFGADPNVIGRTVSLGGEPYEIVGVLPRDFHFPSYRQLFPVPTSIPGPQLWKPFGLQESERNAIGAFNYLCIAKLKAGVSVSGAALELEREQAAVAARLPQRLDLHAVVKPLQAQLVGRSRLGLELLFGAVGVVLLIGCINIANLLLVKTLGRQRELAIRRALGASRGRLARQMLVEGVTLCGAGGLAGVGVAHAAIRLILLIAPVDVPRLDEVGLDARVLLFLLATSGTIGLLIGLVPAWRSGDVVADESMRVRSGGTAGRGTGRMRSLLVGAEVALSAVCLIAGGLLLHSLANLLNVDKGFNTERILTVTASLSGSRYRTTEARSAFRRAAIDRVQKIPGVLSVAMAHNLPLTGVGANSAITTQGTAVPLLERPVADVRMVNPDYFRTWGIPLKAGRIFSEADGDRPVVVVSEFTATHVWPGQDPLGQRFRLGGNPSAPLVEVIGVVGDVRSISLDRPPAFSAYLPYWLQDPPFATLAVKSGADPASLASAVRAAIHEVDPELPVTRVRTMDAVAAESTAERRFQMNLVLFFGAVAIALVGLGIYGVLSHAVVQRTNEIGIRLALGAAPGTLQRMILADALTLVGGGLIVGVPLAIAAGYALRTLLFGVGPQDLPVIAAVCLLLTTAALLAAYIPARRASRIDPIVALRCE
jgi:predicted permease